MCIQYLERSSSHWIVRKMVCIHRSQPSNIGCFLSNQYSPCRAHIDHQVEAAPFDSLTMKPVMPLSEIYINKNILNAFQKSHLNKKKNKGNNLFGMQENIHLSLNLSTQKLWINKNAFEFVELTLTPFSSYFHEVHKIQMPWWNVMWMDLIYYSRSIEIE